MHPHARRPVARLADENFIIHSYFQFCFPAISLIPNKSSQAQTGTRSTHLLISTREKSRDRIKAFSNRTIALDRSSTKNQERNQYCPGQSQKTPGQLFDILLDLEKQPKPGVCLVRSANPHSGRGHRPQTSIPTARISAIAFECVTTPGCIL